MVRISLVQGCLSARIQSAIRAKIRRIFISYHDDDGIAVVGNRNKTVLALNDLLVLKIINHSLQLLDDINMRAVYADSISARARGSTTGLCIAAKMSLLVPTGG